MKIEIACEDFLLNNACVYAIKAKRKKIAIVRIQATNRATTDATLRLESSQLTAGEKTFDAQHPDFVLRKLGEFTWDFLLYALFDFHSIAAVFDATMFLTGPLYNRRLRRQLGQLSASQLVVPAGGSRCALVAFRGVSKEFQRLTIPLRNGDGLETVFEYNFNAS